MKAFEDAGFADDPTFLTFQRQLTVGLVLLLVFSAWMSLSANTTIRPVLSIVLAVMTLGLLVSNFSLRWRDRARRRRARRGRAL